MRAFLSSRMKLGLFGFFIICLMFLFGFGCSKKTQKAIQIKGSDTMVNLGQAWAEEFMKKEPEISIAVTGGGSGTGIAALLNGTTDIAESSRDIEEKELEMAKKKGIEVKEFVVAYDGICVVVHPDNPVAELTIEQLSRIYRGEIKNWKQVGGEDHSMVVLSRDRNSGTHITFLEKVVRLGEKDNKNEYSPELLMLPSSQAIVEEVANNKYAMGYIGVGYVTEKLKALRIAKDKESPYIEPTHDNISKKIYPISRPLYFYTRGEPSGEIKKIIDFVLSEKGQNIVAKMDFVPIK